MEKIQTWAVGELLKLMPEGLLDLEDIRQLVRTVIQQDSTSLNETISSMLDFSRKEVKLFISEFIERVENQKRYEENAKKVQIRTDKATKIAQGAN